MRTDDAAVFAHRYRWDENTLVLLHNLDDKDCSVTLDLSGEEAGKLVDLFGNEVYRPNAGESRVVELAGYGYRWFRVHPLRR